MNMDEQPVAFLDIRYTSIEKDLNECAIFRPDGSQNFSMTLNNYIDLLKKSIMVLELIRDTTNVTECEELEFVTSTNGDSLGVRGNPEIIERYFGFGIANNGNEDSDTNSDDNQLDESDSSNEYNEYCDSSDNSDDTPIGSDDSDTEKSDSDTEKSDSSSEEIISVSKNPLKVQKKPTK
jgi:hypothetical protein